MKRFYVRFAGDNDFVKTVCAFVKTIAPRIMLGTWRDITKEQIAQLFNDTAFALYQLHQAYDFPAEEYTREYLRIEAKDVYFDEEIDAFIDWNGDGCIAALEHHDHIGYYIM